MEEENKPLLKKIMNTAIALVAPFIAAATIGLLAASLWYTFKLGWYIVF